MEKKIETTIVYWGSVGKMEKKMDATIVYSFSNDQLPSLPGPLAACVPADSAIFLLRRRVVEELLLFEGL